MTDTGLVDRADALSVRMIDALDALPIPAGPGGLRPRRTAFAVLDPHPIFLLVLVAIAAVLVTPAGRSAVADAARAIQRMVGASPWSAYYVDVTARDAAGVPAWRLLYAHGTFPGVPTEPDIVSSRLVGHFAERLGGPGGSWSSDGELFATGAGPKVYVADRAGRAREVADLGDANNVYEVAWTGARRISAVARELDRDAVVAIDVRTGATARHPLPLGMRIDPATDEVGKSFSPDGRWIVAPVQRSLGCHAIRLYDLATDRLVELIDGVRARGRPIGWLRDSRLAWATCDVLGQAPSSESTALNVVVSAPDGSGRVAIGTIPQRSSGGNPVIDQARDRILFTSGGADEPQDAVWALGLDGGLSELLRLPLVRQLAPDPAFQRVIHLGTVSRDGRLLAIRLTYYLGIADVLSAYSRAGSVDLATGVVTFACAVSCTGLGLR